MMTSLVNTHWAYAGSMICAQVFSSRTYPYAAETIATKSHRRSITSQLPTWSPPQAVQLDAVRSTDREEQHEAIDSVSYTADITSATEKAPHVPVLLQQVRLVPVQMKPPTVKIIMKCGQIAALMISQVTIALSVQVLDAFKDCSLQTFVDGTLGAGGHSAALIRAHPEMHTLLGIDRDPAAHSIAENTLQAAAEDRETPLDVRQIQARKCSPYCQPSIERDSARREPFDIGKAPDIGRGSATSLPLCTPAA